MNLEDFGLSAHRLIAGFGGGLSHAFVVRNTDPWVLVGSVIVGTLAANYLGPAAQHVAPTWIGDYGAAFIVGYCAIVILQTVETLARKYAAVIKKNGSVEPRP